jgi:hypothetical protein
MISYELPIFEIFNEKTIKKFNKFSILLNISLHFSMASLDAYRLDHILCRNLLL